MAALLAALSIAEDSLGQEFPELQADAPPGHGEVTACEIEGIETGTRCGVYRVWEDRSAAEGRTLDLAFVILDAPDADKRLADVIVPLPGGPGEPFTPAAGSYASLLDPVRGNRDVLLVDVRGVGRSGSLHCPDFEIALEDRFGTVFPLEHIQMCRDRLAARAQLELYTTALSVDDVEELRTWLGYESVNLVGVSYGTRVAQVYMRRHPDAVRTVTLNSVAPVFELGYVQMARLLQRSLDLVLDDCEHDSQCAARYPNVRADLDTVFRRLHRGPVEVALDGRRVEFASGDFAYALRGLLYSRSDDVPAVIASTADGDFNEIVSYYLQRTSWVGSPQGVAGYHLSVVCPEDILPLTDEMVEEATVGTFLGDHLIRGYREACRIWGVNPLQDDFWDPVKSDLPTLVISGEFDPVTPPAWGDAVAEHLPNSVHVIVPGGGHGAGNACVLRLLAQLLETWETGGLDTSCMAER